LLALRLSSRTHAQLEKLIRLGADGLTTDGPSLANMFSAIETKVFLSLLSKVHRQYSNTTAPGVTPTD